MSLSGWERRDGGVESEDVKVFLGDGDELAGVQNRLKKKEA